MGVYTIYAVYLDGKQRYVPEDRYQERSGQMKKKGKVYYFIDKTGKPVAPQWDVLYRYFESTIKNRCRNAK